MARKAAAQSTRKRKADSALDVSDVEPEEFFANAKATPKAKPKAKKAPASSPAPMAVDANDDPAAEIGFPASDLPDIPVRRVYKPPAHSGKAPGQQDIPEGEPECLSGLTFVVTGDFSESRDTMTDMIKTYGGKVTAAVSGRTSYLVVGSEPGSSKVKKAKANRTRCLYEEDLVRLITSTKTSAPPAEEASITEDPVSAASPMEQDPVSAASPMDQDHVSAASPVKQVKTESGAIPMEQDPALARQVKTEPGTKTAPAALAEPASGNRTPPAASELWTDKYRPTKLSELCGHKENAKRILQWLGVWAEGGIPDPRAILISGPPGIGKTTVAHLVAKLAGFDVFELNASETRSKKSLKALLGSAIGNRSVLEFDRARVDKARDQLEDDAHRDIQKEVRTSGSKRLVVIMDEVDGMSSGDRGGNAELIQMIDRTRVPIICICNDRQATSVRSLANHCTDMRFNRPSAPQMRARLNTIAFREGLKIEQNAIEEMVKATHNDIRQIINQMSAYALKSQPLTYMASKAHMKSNNKEVSVSPFEAIQKLLSSGSNMNMPFSEKLGLYYSDFSLMPLFVQENYIDAYPNGAANDMEALERLSSAADMIAEGDVIESRLQGAQQWSLMPVHSAVSCVGPAFYAHGSRHSMIRFPAWLGQNSKSGKMGRLLREVQSHMRLRVATDKTEIRQSYIPAMVPELTQPLIQNGPDGIAPVIGIMDHYYLNKDHWDAMMELHLDGAAILKQIPTAVKSAFTREYKKGSHPVAFQDHAAPPAARAARAVRPKPDSEFATALDDDDDDDDGDAAGSSSAEEGPDESAAKDKLVQAKTKGASTRASGSRSKAQAKAKAKPKAALRKRRKV
ncbi:DNA replication factor C complex subunit Rfc1 [Coemansia sp. RSA 552]|nr:DNA replication factor C complex subunit Rfc1 [Coemansia sp. RSA 552]